MAFIRNNPYERLPPPVLAQPTLQQGFPLALQTIPVNVLPGLECLTQLNGLKVKQKVEILEVLCGCEINNKYDVMDLQGTSLFSAKEDTDWCTRNCCGPIRPFDMEIKDYTGQEIIHLVRPLACQSCCFPSCLQSLEVYAPRGQLVGKVEQEWSLIAPRLVVKDADGNAVLRIEGPLCPFSCCCENVDFDVLSVDGAIQIGKISKVWTGLCKEAFTDADNFEMSFPIDLGVKIKAVMLGALFLIDFMYFEKTGLC